MFEIKNDRIVTYGWTILLITLKLKTVHPKMKIRLKPIRYLFIFRSKMKIFWWNLRAFCLKLILNRRNCYFSFLCSQQINPRSFINLWLNHWCHMDYFNDVLTLLHGPWTCQLCCCLWRVRKLSDFIKNILNCVLKINEGLMSLERHEGE